MPIATGGPECRLCPVCQLIGIVREGSPEVVDHLARASDSLLAAFRAAVVAHERSWAHGQAPDVQHIDIGQGPLDRWRGIVKLTISTASPASDGSLPGIEPHRAEELRARILARAEADDGV